MSLHDCCDICSMKSWEIGAVQLQTTREDKATFEVCAKCFKALRKLILEAKAKCTA